VKILLNFVLIFFVVYTDVGLIVVDHDRKGRTNKYEYPYVYGPDPFNPMYP